MFGNIASGLTGTAGQLLSTTFNRSNFGNDDPEIRDGAGNIFTPAENNVKFIDGTWYKAAFNWTPTTGRTGNFTIEIRTASTNAVLYNITTSTTHTFDSNAAWFAFGDIDSAGGAYYDNISINGTTIPEPSIALLGGLGLLTLLRRRTR